MSREAFAAAARALVGTRFRLLGRLPETGLDCVGLVACALAAAGRDVRAPTGYALRNTTIEPWLRLAGANGFGAVSSDEARGDLLLARPGPGQHHLIVALGGGEFVHAHAGLGRVVVQPEPLAWPVLRRWRLIEPE